MADEADRNWTEVLDQTYIFNRKQREVNKTCIVFTAESIALLLYFFLRFAVCKRCQFLSNLNYPCSFLAYHFFDVFLPYKIKIFRLALI